VAPVAVRFHNIAVDWFECGVWQNTHTWSKSDFGPVVVEDEDKSCLLLRICASENATTTSTQSNTIMLLVRYRIVGSPFQKGYCNDCLLRGNAMESNRNMDANEIRSRSAANQPSIQRVGVGCRKEWVI
jgi:hypothetical protein